MIYKTLKKVSEYCQLLDKSKFPATQTVYGVTFTNNGDGTITVNGTCTNQYYSGIYLNIETDKMNPGHIYFNTAGGSLLLEYSGGYLMKSNNTIFTLPEYEYIQTRVAIRISSGVTVSDMILKPQLFDLTEMYGAGNEPTTVEQFRQDFPEELYDYKPYCFVKSYKNCLTCTTKNLFDIPLVQGYPSNTEGFDNTTLRTFTFGTYLIGMSRNNYYVPIYVTNVNISKNSISFKTSSAGFGISVPFLLTVGNTYTVSCKADNNFYPSIGITYYKEDGTLISFTDSEIITNNPVKSFTVPENTYYTLILFYGRQNNEYTFSNIQLEEGSTASEYQPYGYIQSRKKSLKVTDSILL